MIDPPTIAEHPAMHAAVIALFIACDDMRKYFGLAIAELHAELARQGIAAAGPVFAHHRRRPPGMFDFAVGVPVAQPVAAAGRVEPCDHSATPVARTVYHGDDPGPFGARSAFGDWIAANGHRPATDLSETYLRDPARVPDPAAYRTQLDRPLA